MTATNMCSNFGGFRCVPPYYQELGEHLQILLLALYHTLILLRLSQYFSTGMNMQLFCYKFSQLYYRILN